MKAQIVCTTAAAGKITSLLESRKKITLTNEMCRHTYVYVDH